MLLASLTVCLLKMVRLKGIKGNAKVRLPERSHIGTSMMDEKKLAAMQLLQQKETQKEIAQKDAEIRIEEAKGIAQAQEIINTPLTENYLQHEAINAQRAMANSPNHTTVYIPVGSNGITTVYTTSGK